MTLIGQIHEYLANAWMRWRKIYERKFERKKLNLNDLVINHLMGSLTAFAVSLNRGLRLKERATRWLMKDNFHFISLYDCQQFVINTSDDWHFDLITCRPTSNSNPSAASHLLRLFDPVLLLARQYIIHHQILRNWSFCLFGLPYLPSVALSPSYVRCGKTS